MLKNIKKLFARLIAWQKRPVTMRPLSDEEHTCQNCAHTYTGNYCPRCGQTAKTMRISVRNLIRIFLDTWGLGAHSLIRTMGNLLTRPGYMIGDYLDGRRQPYFPPFKTLFVIGTLYAFVYFLGAHYSTIVDDQAIIGSETEVTYTNSDTDKDKALVEVSQSDDIDHDKVEQEINQAIFSLIDSYRQFQRDHMVLNQLLLHLVLAFFAMRMFRRAPRHPRLNYSENVVAQVYICAQTGFIASVWMLLCLICRQPVQASLPGWLSLFIVYVDYKQLFGYRIWGTLWRTILSEFFYMLFMVVVFIVALSVSGVAAAYHATMP